MFFWMESSPVPFDVDAPLGGRLAIIRRNPDLVDEIEMVEAGWGSNPRFSGGETYRFVRADGRTFPSHCCLIRASEFHMTVAGEQYRVTLDGDNFFYLAGIWEEEMAGWPLSYRIVNVAANLEVGPFQDRHGAIILRRQVMQWLDLRLPEADLLATPPARTFVVEQIGASGPPQSAFAL